MSSAESAGAQHGASRSSRTSGAGTAPGAGLASAPLREIARSMAHALLAGDEPLSDGALNEAARFLGEAAGNRPAGKPAIALETVSGPAGERFMRIAVVNDDMPFLVDSVTGTITAESLEIARLVHPVIRAVRDDHGNLLQAGGEGGSGTRESMIYIETGRVDARRRQKLLAALADTLADVVAAVADWQAMRTRLAADAAEVARVPTHAAQEAADLLRWFESGMLTQLGHVERRRDGTLGCALGICREDARAILAVASYDRAFAWFDAHPAEPLLAVKSNRIGRVHRRAPLDLFLLPVHRDGKLVALSVHVGLWTSAALATPPAEVPVLRAHLNEIARKLRLDPRGHAGKALVHALTAMPHDLLVSFTRADVERVATIMMSVTDRPRPRLALVCAPLDRHLFAFAWLPRDAMSTEVRQQVETLIASACDAPLLDWSLAVEGPLAQLRFVFDLRSGCAVAEEGVLDAELQALVRGWDDAVEAELARLKLPGGPARAAPLATRYGNAFPIAYRAAHGPAEAAQDIVRLHGLASRRKAGGAARALRLHRADGDAADRSRLKVYQHVGGLDLSDAVPALENFGFRVAEDVPTQLAGDAGSIHDFLLIPPRGLDPETLAARQSLLETALETVANGAAEDDAFNRLVPAAGLALREANWLRAIFRYLRQTGLSFAIATVVAALEGAPQVARGLVDLLRARHDPERAGDEQTEAAAQESIRAGLAGVAAINDDRVLRRFHAVVEAILRTNAFLPDAQELAFKIDSALVPGLPAPVPWREVFVFSRQVEGIHLRAGPVARGGIRWSDRRDDFRTEILGLMKAQRVKNAVIVPTGAKGGFYPKRLPDPAADRDGWLAEGLASYKAFIRTLLSITDNIVGGKVVHAKGIVVRDGEDPYFVVAADKGTASFSDTANGIAAAFDFWLDDAFASGGSKGYDHKAMGITAKGAWLSVQRHFGELGVDVQSDPVSVVGCGDMSGDVFGNGMLLSKSLRLLAAFDHRHIFLDPAPDPATSWQERSRLFALPRSSWDDYDKRLISEGGGVYPRSMKSIPLSPQVRTALGIEGDTIEPDRLIGAILRAPVDLLWFGGIGTYVKSSAEGHADVGDPANDALRVDGAEVRARVIGEGANLGCTQTGRIEYALSGGPEGRGGRNNTDFIDNSAGVDCSDKEVNIKIALADARRAGRLDEDGRVALLQQMTGDVAALVLEDNRLQALALSIAEAGGPSALPAQARVIEVLVETGFLDRKSERLPAADVLTRRAGEGRGLTRPELAVILSSAKLALQGALEESAQPDDPLMEAELLAAFPAEMQNGYRAEIERHRLRREIIATRIANRVINRIGFVHPFELAEEEGVPVSAVAGAFVATERLLGLPALWQAIEGAAMPESARTALFDAAAGAARIHAADLLRLGSGHAAPSSATPQLADGVASLMDIADGLTRQAGTASARLLAELTSAGAPAELAARTAQLAAMDGAIGIAALAGKISMAPADLTALFARIGSALGLDWAQSAAASMDPSDPWDRLLVGGLSRDFQQMRLAFLDKLAASAPQDLAGAVDGWLAAQAQAAGQLRALVSRAQDAGNPTPAMLARIASQARGLLTR